MTCLLVKPCDWPTNLTSQSQRKLWELGLVRPRFPSLIARLFHVRVCVHGIGLGNYFIYLRFTFFTAQIANQFDARVFRLAKILKYDRKLLINLARYKKDVKI